MNPTAPRRTAAPSTPPDAAGRDARDAQLASLLAAVAAGDGRAFESFYDLTLRAAHVVARRLLPPDDVEDLLADAYFEAWRQAAQFDPTRGSAMTWLLNRVRSRALDRLRRLAVHPEGAAEPPDEAGSEHDLIELLWQRQAGARLRQALAALEPRERWALGLAYFRDCSHAEIARQTGLALGTVKSVLARAQARLRAALAGPTS